jgi:hypothetical protein
MHQALRAFSVSCQRLAARARSAAGSKQTGVELLRDKLG